MITKKTLSFALVALCTASVFAAKPKAKRKSTVKPGMVRKTAGFAGRVASSRPVMLVVGCLTYPILQKTLFADTPLLDVPALASYVSNKWQNNWAQVKKHANTLCNTQEAKTALDVVQTGLAATHQFYRHNIASPFLNTYYSRFAEPMLDIQVRLTDGTPATSKDALLYNQVESMLNRKYYGNE